MTSRATKLAHFPPSRTPANFSVKSFTTQFQSAAKQINQNCCECLLESIPAVTRAAAAAAAASSSKQQQHDEAEGYVHAPIYMFSTLHL
jgi:hypothetical protein